MKAFSARLRELTFILKRGSDERSMTISGSYRRRTTSASKVLGQLLIACATSVDDLRCLHVTCWSWQFGVQLNAFFFWRGMPKSPCRAWVGAESCAGARRHTTRNLPPTYLTYGTQLSSASARDAAARFCAHFRKTTPSFSVCLPTSFLFCVKRAYFFDIYV